jgi:hypothetical protein
MRAPFRTRGAFLGDEEGWGDVYWSPDIQFEIFLFSDILTDLLRLAIHTYPLKRISLFQDEFESPDERPAKENP